MRYYLLTIYLWFLLTASAAGAVFALATLSAPEGTFWGKRTVVVGDTMSLHAAELAEIYERGGPTVLAADLSRLRTTLALNVLLCDAEGNPLTAGEKDTALKELVDGAARTGKNSLPT